MGGLHTVTGGSRYTQLNNQPQVTKPHTLPNTLTATAARTTRINFIGFPPLLDAREFLHRASNKSYNGSWPKKQVDTINDFTDSSTAFEVRFWRTN
jgi:hypothetical protein